MPELSFEVVICEGESGWLIVECPALPGCRSQGKSEQECLDNIREAITGWIEVQLEKRKEEAASRAGAGGLLCSAEGRRKEVKMCFVGAT